MNILLVGSGAREHAIARALKRSNHAVDLFCVGSSRNPGIQELSTGYTVGNITDSGVVAEFGKTNRVHIAIVGPEAPLETGVADALQAIGARCVGPTQQLAQLETSKSFTRNLLTKYNIPGMPMFQSFSSLEGLQEFITSLPSGYVVKADGLMSGKGVKVSGEHLVTVDEGLVYAKECIERDGSVLIEEKLIGQEFSLMSFCDGDHLAHMPTVQDHKRVFENDEGPNTGGMGSYSDANLSLPFLADDDIAQARAINEATVAALKKEFGVGYKGILYGGFMATKDGVKLIEYNARFGDPESMNVLAILESDFVELCQAIVNGMLTQDHARFAHKATVCKYAVPEGYPDHPVKGRQITVPVTMSSFWLDQNPIVDYPSQIYFAAVDRQEDGQLIETGGRTAAMVGIADTIAEAEQIAESAIQKIQGPLFHRKDIGTEVLIQKRVEMMKNLRS